MMSLRDRIQTCRSNLGLRFCRQKPWRPSRPLYPPAFWRGNDSVSGITLIELVIIIVALSLVLGTMLAVLGSVAQNTILPYNIQIAAGLAEQELERVSGMRFSQVANEGPTAFPAPHNSFTYQVAVSAVPVSIFNDPGMTRYKQATITVSNTTMGSVNLVTIVTNN